MIGRTSVGRTPCASVLRSARGATGRSCWRKEGVYSTSPAHIVSNLIDVTHRRLMRFERLAARILKDQFDRPDERLVVAELFLSRRSMRCPHCDHRDSLARSRSKDSWVWRLVLRRMVRCHWCRNRFLIPVWTRLPQIGLDMLSRSIDPGIEERRSPATGESHAA